MFTQIFKFRQFSPKGEILTRRIGIKGMTCRNCERTVKKALLTKTGVRRVYLNRETGTAEISFDSAQTSVEALNQVISRKGYFPTDLEAEPVAASVGEKK